MKSVVCTLFEGDYHMGAAALINSLQRNGFSGVFICGHRGPRPPWAAQAAGLLPRIELRWRQLETDIHLTNYKPTFIRECMASVPADPDNLIFYMDPDLVAKCPWQVIERWAKPGIAVVEDLNASMPERHPYRLAWHELYDSRGRAAARPMNRYYNGGFVGLGKQKDDFLKLWEEIIGWSAELNVGLRQLKNAEPHVLFHSADQDALNMALELSTIPVNAAGPEAMDFAPGGHLLSHAAGGTKPWRGGFLASALAGRPPSLPQKLFYQYADAPIPIFTRRILKARGLQLRLAGLIGRFYSRK